MITPIAGFSADNSTPIPLRVMIAWARSGATPPSWHVFLAKKIKPFEKHPRWWQGITLALVVFGIFTADLMSVTAAIWAFPASSGVFCGAMFGFIFLLFGAALEQARRQKWRERHALTSWLGTMVQNTNLTLTLFCAISIAILAWLSLWTTLLTYLEVAVSLSAITIVIVWIIDMFSSVANYDVLVITPAGFVESDKFIDDKPTSIFFREIINVQVAPARDAVIFTKSYGLATVWRPATTYAHSPIEDVLRAYAHYRLSALLTARIREMR